ncbi:MAG: hypothetical protein B7Z80_17520 [Rhodospirillales bacterium 20-64-7]|nr:MAG: hypothetical protein B7Z80_17520 [Rhodospirillales bacterium 20-64-7]HQT78869.1 response regulator [Rhodopila sp.]
MKWGFLLTEKGLVLVVEDDPLVSDVIAAALDDTYATVVVETSQDALGVLSRDDVRLMLLDCTLPGGVSPDLLPEADRRGAPVILMSGDPERIRKISDLPRPFIRKPFTLAGLLDTVATVLAAGPNPGVTTTR